MIERSCWLRSEQICNSTRQILSSILGETLQNSSTIALNHLQLFLLYCFQAHVRYMGSHILPNKGLRLLHWTNELMNDGHIILHSSCNNAAEERQQRAALLPAKPPGITLSHPPSWLFAPYLSLFYTFAASIIFEESQIFHGHASGRFPSTWDGSIISSSFAWLKLDKHNALCSTGNAVCIILVFEYISEYLPMDWSQLLPMSSLTHIKSHSRMNMNVCCEGSSWR